MPRPFLRTRLRHRRCSGNAPERQISLTCYATHIGAKVQRVLRQGQSTPSDVQTQSQVWTKSQAGSPTHLLHRGHRDSVGADRFRVWRWLLSRVDCEENSVATKARTFEIARDADLQWTMHRLKADAQRTPAPNPLPHESIAHYGGQKHKAVASTADTIRSANRYATIPPAR